MIPHGWMVVHVYSVTFLHSVIVLLGYIVQGVYYWNNPPQPNQTTVYTEFYIFVRHMKKQPQTMVKFCVLSGHYSYSNMTNYFKMNYYCKFYGKMVIGATATMSDNSELPG